LKSVLVPRSIAKDMKSMINLKGNLLSSQLNLGNGILETVKP